MTVTPTVTRTPTATTPADTTAPAFFSTEVSEELILTDGGGCPAYERTFTVAALVADEGGIDALTMRRIGQALGVEAMALYRHVSNKDDIIDGIVDLVWAEIGPTEIDTDWKEAMRERGMSLGMLFTGRVGFYERLGWCAWPLANALYKIGRSKEAQDEWKRSIELDVKGKFSKKAAERLRLVE